MIDTDVHIMLAIATLCACDSLLASAVSGNLYNGVVYF